MRFVNYEVKPCRELIEGGERFTEACEPCDAQFWTVYGRYPDGTAQAIANLDTEHSAITMRKAIEFVQSFQRFGVVDTGEARRIIAAVNREERFGNSAVTCTDHDDKG